MAKPDFIKFFAVDTPTPQGGEALTGGPKTDGRVSERIA